MDIDSLISHSRARFDHESARRILKEKYEAKMLFAHNGGMFRAGPELLVLLDACGVGSLIIQDLYNNPVQVDTKELRLLALDRWQEQMNAWLVEYTDLNKQR